MTRQATADVLHCGGTGGMWWVMDDSIDAIGAQLEKQGYCILDGFLTNEQVRYLGQPATGPR